LLDVIGARLLPLLFGIELLASGLGSLLGTAFYSKFIPRSCLPTLHASICR